MEHKVGFYIDESCGLDERIDLDEVEKVATGEFKVAICKRIPDVMTEEGTAAIREDIANEGINTVVVAGRSQREATPFLDFPDCVVEIVNLREQVLWTHDPEFLVEELEEDEDEVEENINMMANDYTRMGIIKATQSEVPTPYIVESPKRVLVIGGGIAGISAALNVAKVNFEAVLVEKKEELGGWASKLYRDLPASAPFEDLPESKIAAMAEEVKANDKVTIYTGCEVTSISGAPGEFKVELSNGETAEVGSVIVAAGWKPFDTAKYDPKYQYGENKNVITSIELEEMIKKEGKIIRPSDGEEVTNVTFITDVDTVDDENITPYRGNVADITALKQIHYLLAQNPAATPYLFHDHVKSPGLYEDLFRQVQSEGLVLVRGQLKSIGEGEERPLFIEGSNKLLAADVMMETDLVVLSTGMVPTTLDEEVLHLEYRQGPELPQLSHGYPNSHFICFPYETRRTGIYTCGTVREPMVMSRAIDDAAGAALKAVQVIELVSKGQSAHPRVGDTSFPDINFKRCTQCKRCTEECPFGALDEDEKGTPILNPSRCRRCGTCMGACPERIISFANYSVGMIGNMIKGIEVPDEFEEKPRILVFACENDAYPAMDMLSQNHMNYSSYIRIIPLRCLGSMSLVWIADALASGFDGILLLGCKHGENYQCHFVKGSELANTRMEKVSETLERLMLEPERIRFEQVNITDYKTLPTLINDFAEEIGEMDPNPYKD